MDFSKAISTRHPRLKSPDYRVRPGFLTRGAIVHVVPSPPCALTTKVACTERTVTGCGSKRSHQPCNIINTARNASRKGRSDHRFTDLAISHQCSKSAVRNSCTQPVNSSKSIYKAFPTHSCSTNKQRQKKPKSSKTASAQGFPPSSPSYPRIPR